MKSSRSVNVAALAVISSMVITACGESVTADCVTSKPRADGAYQLVDERYCNGGSHSSYFWYYGGTTSHGYVRGGTTVKPPQANITSRNGRSIQRGGFGSSKGGGSRGG